MDGFSAANVAKLVNCELDGLCPCTALGIYNLLCHYGIDIAGKHVVMVGRSSIVGRPVSLLFSRKLPDFDATVTLCHSKTKNLPDITRSADILIVAIGKAHFITGDMVSDGAVVVDVGINRSQMEGGSIVGDVDFRDVAPKCYAISPVPGGVGPMTVITLMQNVVLATKRQNDLQ